MKSGATSSRTRARVGFSALLVGAGLLAEAGCGGRYEVTDGSAGGAQAVAGASVVGRAGEPDVVITQPGNPAGAPSFGGAFGVGGGMPLPAGGSFGVGGGGTTMPGRPSVCDGLGTRALDAGDAELDDFEAPFVSSSWSTFADLGPPGVDDSDNTLLMMLTSPGAAGTNTGGEYFGMGANVAKGAGFGVGAILNVAIDATSRVYCADISAFDGISFWAKTGVSDAVFDVNFVLPSTNGVSSDPIAGGGDCLTGCYNHPRKRVALTGTWDHYAIRFADAAGGSAKVQNLIQEIGWLSPDSHWDFSLDEIAFYKGVPPAGAIRRMPDTR